MKSKTQPQKQRDTKHFPKTDLFCVGCGKSMGSDEKDRFDEFMVPHWESCRSVEVSIGDLFEWRPI